MKKRMKVIAAIIIGISILLQTGCWDQKIYERIGFILQLGLELNEEGEMLFTITTPTVAPDIKAEVEVISTTANLLREGREKARLVSGKTVEGGKIQHVYFSKELAQKGVSGLFELFIRNPENPLLSNVVVVDGSPKEMIGFSAEFKDKPRPAFYVNDLLADARESAYTPETRIYHFVILEYSKTIDPITPLIRYTNKEIQLAGSALFSGDKMVGEINTTETGLLLAVMGRKRNVSYIYTPKDIGGIGNEIKRGAAIQIKNAKRKIKINTEGDSPTIDIKLDFRASIEEYDGPHNLDDPDEIKKIEEEAAQSIKKEYMKLLKYLQEIGSDPVGFNEMFRAKHHEYWKTVTWKDIYKDISFNVDVNLDFEHYGAIN